MNKFLISALASAITVSPAWTQNAAPVAAVPVVAQTPQAAEYFLPANTELTVSLNEELNTQRNEEGDTFNMSVVHDVRLGQFTVIPAGARAVGEITWMTGKGMFGKSGKMDIEMRYIDLNGRRIPIEGSFRQEGEGNTVATVAGVIAIPIAGLFITGHSGVIPRGRELTVHLGEQLAVALPAGATLQEGSAVAAQPVAARSAAVPVTASTGGAAQVETMPANNDPEPFFPGVTDAPGHE